MMMMMMMIDVRH